MVALLVVFNYAHFASSTVRLYTKPGAAASHRFLAYGFPVRCAGRDLPRHRVSRADRTAFHRACTDLVAVSLRRAGLRAGTDVQLPFRKKVFSR